VYDITGAELANGIGSYMSAMRAFAECAEATPEPVGYCHDAIDDARFLANQDVCMGAAEDDPATPDVDEAKGSNHDIGSHHEGCAIVSPYPALIYVENPYRDRT
jgi:hypothetical protein